MCVVSNEDIAGNLIKKEINTINFGVTDTGPLVSLGILKYRRDLNLNRIKLYNDLGGNIWRA